MTDRRSIAPLPAADHQVPTATILISVSLMLSVAMGMRQSMGLLQPAVLAALPVTAADYALAIAVQNLVWGLTQPLVGMSVDRLGSRPVMLAGAGLYLLGLLVARAADGAAMLMLGIGLSVGLAMSCVGSTVAMNVTSRTVSPARRSVAMGLVSAAGSIGLLGVSPLAQTALSAGGHAGALGSFALLALIMLPAAWLAGRADHLQRDRHGGSEQSMGQALREAAAHPGFVVMTVAYFVCGLQLVFLTTHLPTYISMCGMPSSVAAATLGLIGLFNAFGSLAFGWLGGRYSRRFLLGGIYLLRSAIITAYFMSVPTPLTTLLFGAVMGALWLGVVPLVNGLVIQLFGMRYMATLVGIAFFSHQLGSFVGAWGGGLILSTLGSYEWAWRGAVMIGVLAGITQMTMSVRPVPRLAAAA
ncbi:MAG: MFS transporter [Burkholderiaceae bacterium]